jgi:hypothetical protein
VTVTKIVDPTRAESGFLAPEPDERLVAVQFRLENTGSETYTDSPQNGAAVVDQEDQRFEASYVPATAGRRRMEGPQDARQVLAAPYAGGTGSTSGDSAAARADAAVMRRR